MNKKLFTLPALMLVAVAGFSATASAESINGSLGVKAGAPGINVSAQAKMRQDDDGKGKDMRGGMNGVFGTVTAISGTTITVQTKSWTKGSTTSVATNYTVNASAAVIDKNRVTGSLSTIAIGDTVMVEGTVSGTTVTATKIHDGVMMKGAGDNNGATVPEGNGQPIVGGTVTAVNGSSITITNKSNVSYTIDASAAKITKNGTTSTVSTIAVGDSLLAQGTVNGTSVTAVSIIDTNATTTAHVGFFGKIGSFFAKIFGFNK